MCELDTRVLTYKSFYMFNYRRSKFLKFMHNDLIISHIHLYYTVSFAKME